MPPLSMRAIFRLVPVLALSALLSTHASAANFTWLGDIDSNWNSGTPGTNTNWVSNTLPGSGDSLIFSLAQSGVTLFTASNDIAGLTLGGTNAITFTNDASTNGFTLTGNAITLGGNITSTVTTGTHTHTIQLDLILSGTRTVTAVNNTTIVISGNISESTVGAGFGFIKAGVEQVTLTGINSFTGALSVSAGTLSVNSVANSGVSSAIGAGSVINIGSAATTAGILVYTGAAASTNRTVNLAATTTGAANINSSGTGALVFNGTFTNAGSGAKTLTLGGSSLDNNEIQSILSDGSSGGTLALVKGNAGTWLLSGLNTYTGSTSVNQGILSINSIADSGVASAIGAGSVISIGNASTTAGTLTYTGSGGSTNRAVNLAATATANSVINSSGTGALIFTGIFTNASTTGTKTLTLGGTSLDNNEIRSILSDGGNGGNLMVTKTGAATWLLSGLNTYTGNTTINQGILSINSIGLSGVASAIGAGSIINFGSAGQSGTLFYSGAAATTDRTINLASAGVGGAVIDASGTGALILTGAVTNAATSGTKVLTLNGTATNNDFQGIISDGGNGGVVAVTKGDTGTWILSGLNTFTGALSINRATLTVNTIANGGVASAIGAGSTINFGNALQTGTLLYTGGGAATDRAIVLASTSTGGGTITNNGSGALLFTGAFSNTGTGAKTFTLNGTNTGANEFQGALVDSTGGVLTFVKSGAGAWTLSGTSSFTGALSVSQGTLTITSLGDSGVSSAAGAGGTINLGSSTNLAGILVYTGSGASSNRAINLAATTNGAATINSSGTGALIFTGAMTNSGTGTKTLTLGGTYTGGNEIRTSIADGSGTLVLAKADAGTWVLSAANSYSGGTTLNAGTLVLNSAAAIGTGTLTITGGALDNTTGTLLTLTTNNAIALNGSLAFGGTSSLSLGTGVVTIGNANRDITLNGGSTLTMGEVQWNSAANNRTLTVNQGTGSGGTLVLGGFQLNINADTVVRTRIITGTGNVTINGAVSNGTGNVFDNNLTYSGSGTLTLSAVNSYTGTTTVNGGTLLLSGSGSISTSKNLVINAGTLDVGGTAASVVGGLTLGSTASTVAGQAINIISSTSGGSLTLGDDVTYNSGAAGFENGQATISANLILTADRAITVNDSPNAAVDVLVSGVISGSFMLTKGNGGTLRLTGTNTYTGQTQFNNGVTEILTLGNIGVAGSLGTGDKDATAGILRFGLNGNTGTLSYIGTGDSSNRRVQIGSGTNSAGAIGGGTILSNGSGALVFTATTFNSAIAVGATGPATARVLTLGGSNTSANTIQGAIINNTGAGTSGTNQVAVVKQDAGVWILAGASSYGGGTTINGGTLLVNNATGSATGTGAVSISSGGRLGGSGTAGSLIGSATFTEQSGGVIFAGQNGIMDAQTLTLQAAGGFALSGRIELDITGGGASGVLNAQSNNNDLLTFSGGAVALTGATLSLHTSLALTSGAWAAGSSWKLINWTTVSGTFANLPTSGATSGNLADLPDLSSLGLAWDWSQLYTSGVLSIVVAPEPSRLLLLLSGLSWVLLRRRRLVVED